MITAIDTIRSVARHAADHPPGPRAVPDQPESGRTRTGGPAAACLAGLFPRVVQILVRLLFAQGSGDPIAGSGGISSVLTQALATFVPFLDLGWLPADPGGVQGPNARVEARIDLLRQERTARARLRSAVARHRPAQPVRPDRSPEDRGATILGFPWPAAADDGLWHDLLDLTSEVLEICIVFGHQPGVRRCAELLEVLAEVFDVDRPEAA